MKKYQVFISSTYIDLKEARQKVINALLMNECIPAGMEAFFASDEEQFNVIKKVIDLCDYYILILGNRYGSVNEKTEKSYTEMEYEYALEKGLPVLVFAQDESLCKESEESEINHSKLILFKKRVMKDRMSAIWTSPDELAMRVAISLNKSIQETPRPGWIRGSDKVDDDKTDRITVNELNEMIELHFKENVRAIITDGRKLSKAKWSLSLGTIFLLVGTNLYSDRLECDFRYDLNDIVSDYHLVNEDYTLIKGKLIALGYIEAKTMKVNKQLDTYILLTQKGKKTLDHIITHGLFKKESKPTFQHGDYSDGGYKW